MTISTAGQYRDAFPTSAHEGLSVEQAVEFERYLNAKWPLWLRHKGGVMYHVYKQAFLAGWQAGRNEAYWEEH